jgi:ATP-binding cassette subfamily F protein uup
MEQFWFDADAQWAQVGTLSGGERRRLQLLIALGSLPNVLLLDEPTNDLDLDTLRALEDYLEAWPGTAVVVSHDRALLERTVEDVVVLTADGKHRTGLYAQYEEARRRTAGGTVSRQATAVSPPKETAARPAASAPEGKAAKARSASTLRRLIDQAEKVVGEAERERDRQAAALAALPSEDHLALGRAAHDLAEAEAKLAVAEERWLALAEELGI